MPYSQFIPKLAFASLLFSAALSTPGDSVRAADSRRPNILFLLADDQRPDTIRALGNSEIRTPTLDKLVREGTTFRRAIVAIPICVASRAEMLTGRDGLENTKKDFGFSPHPEAAHWATTLQAAGYRTCYVGKWHTTGRPSQYGYRETRGLFGSGGGKYPLTYPRDWKGMEVTGYRGWVFQTDDRKLYPDRGIGLTPDISWDFADAAIKFLATTDAEPFFLHVNFTAPHDPLFYPEEFEKAYPPETLSLPANFRERHPFDHGNFEGRDEKLYHWPRTPEETRSGLSVYYSVIEHLDRQVGRVLKKLDEVGQLENTIVIYSSDHGLAMGSHGLRGKQNMYEHSIGVPLIFRGPGVPEGEMRDTPCYLRDLFPTTCDFAGVDIPESVQGKSLKPAIADASHRPYDELYAHFRDSQRMVRTERWKFVSYPLAGREQLFDLSSDPDELRDLIADAKHAETASRLRRKLTEWRRRHNDPTLKK